MSGPRDRVEFDAQLLRFLREEIGEPRLAYAEPPVEIPGGAGVHVYGFRLTSAPVDVSRPLVVRVWRTPGHPDAASFESCLQNIVAELGYPVPKVLLSCDDPTWLGASFQVMERAAGAPLLDVGNNASDTGEGTSPLAEVIPELGRVFFRDWPRRLALLHTQLHGLDARTLLETMKVRGFDPRRIQLEANLERLEATIEAYDLKGLDPGVQWLREHLPSGDERLAICHGDFFANQVFVEQNRSTVLDWTDALVAPAEIDVGIVRCGIETIPVALPGPLQRVATQAQRWLARRFVAAYRELRPVDSGLMRFGEVLRAIQTLVGVSVRRLASAGAIVQKPGPDPYDSPLGVELLRGHLASAASVEVEAPPPRVR